MRRFNSELGVAIRVVVATMVLTGLIYPLAMTGAAQVLFNHRANGSLVTVNGQVAGSSLIGQSFTSAKYFHGRPSATADANGNPDPYKADASTASNLGPTNPQLILHVEQNADAVRCTDGLPPGPPPTATPASAASSSPSPSAAPACTAVRQADTQIPVDAATASASGLDPDVSVSNAILQVPRVAQARGLSDEQVRSLVQEQVYDRQFGVLSERRVNVFDLNMALDRLSAGAARGATP